MSKTIKTHEELLKLHGRSVTCEIQGEKINDAKICVEDGVIYVCQNKTYGCYSEDKLGYSYSWNISSNKNNYEEYDRMCKNIELIEENGENMDSAEKVIKELKDRLDSLTPKVITNAMEKSYSEWDAFNEVHNALRKKAMGLSSTKLKSFIKSLNKLT